MMFRPPTFPLSSFFHSIHMICCISHHGAMLRHCCMYIMLCYPQLSHVAPFARITHDTLRISHNSHHISCIAMCNAYCIIAYCISRLHITTTTKNNYQLLIFSVGLAPYRPSFHHFLEKSTICYHNSVPSTSPIPWPLHLHLFAIEPAHNTTSYTTFRPLDLPQPQPPTPTQPPYLHWLTHFDLTFPPHHTHSFLHWSTDQPTHHITSHYITSPQPQHRSTPPPHHTTQHNTTQHNYTPPHYSTTISQ